MRPGLMQRRVATAMDVTALPERGISVDIRQSFDDAIFVFPPREFWRPVAVFALGDGFCRSGLVGRRANRRTAEPHHPGIDLGSWRHAGKKRRGWQWRLQHRQERSHSGGRSGAAAVGRPPPGRRHAAPGPACADGKSSGGPGAGAVAVRLGLAGGAEIHLSFRSGAEGNDRRPVADRHPDAPAADRHGNRRQAGEQDEGRGGGDLAVGHRSAIRLRLRAG